MTLRTLSVLLIFLGILTKGFSAEACRAGFPVLAAEVQGSGNGQWSIIISTVTAQYTGGHTVQLSWTSYKESDNSFFSVEHSRDGINWVQVAQLQCNGDQVNENIYEYPHETAAGGDNYYRVVYNDVAGNVACSKTSYAKVPSPIDLGVFQNLCAVEVTVPCAHAITNDIHVRGIFGRELQTQLRIENDKVTAFIGELPEGIYFLQCGGEATYRFIKLQ